MDDGTGRGSEGHGGGDDFIAGADVLTEQGHMKGSRAGVHRNGVFCPQIVGKPLFKLDGFGAFCQPAGTQGIDYLVDFRVGNVGHVIGNKGISFLKLTHESTVPFCFQI